MAEYRGLTIRIGADASRFTAALRATQGAIADTQKNLNQLKKALQFDPGSKNAAALYVGELQSQAVSAAAKVQTLQRGIDDLRASMSRMDPKSSIGDIANQTDNAALSARRAREAYNDVTAALASMYTNLSELSHKTFDLSDKEVEKKIQEFRDAGKSLREARAEIRRINEERGGKTFNESNSNLDDIRAELDRLVEAGKLSSEQADNAYQRIERLKGVFRDFGEQLGDSLDVAAVHNYTVEMEKLDAQVKALAEQRVAAAKNDFSDSLERDRTLIRNAADEAQEAVDRFKLLDDAFQLDPTDFDKAAARTSALDDAIASTAEHADELRAALRKYEDAGFTALASETPNLAQALDDAKVSANEAEQRVIEFKNELSDVESRINKARVDGADYLIPGLDEQRETLRQIIVAAEEYSNEMLSAFQRLQNASDARDTANQLQTVENTLTELQNTARDTAAVIEALASNMRDAMPNELETRLGSAREQLDGLATESRRAQDALEQFDKRLQLDPGNAEKIADKMHAIEVATEAANAELEQTRSIIARYEASGIDKVADSTPNLAQALADAEQRARYASVALAAMKESAENFDASQIKQMEEALERAVAEAHEFESAQGLNEARSAAMGLVNTLGELRASAREVRLDQALSSSKAEIKATEDAVEGLSQEVERVGNAFELADKKFELNPASIENMRGRFDALQTAITTTKEQISFLESAIGDLESRGIDDSVKSMRNLAAAAERAKTDFAEFDTKAGDLKNQLSTLRQKMSRLDEGSSEFRELAQQADNVESELKQVESAAERALAEIKQFGEANALRGLKNQLEDAKSTLLGFQAEMNPSLFNQDSLATSTMAVIQEVGQEARQVFDGIVDSTTSLDDALTEAKKTVNDLDDDGFERLKKSAVDLSKTQPIDASTILSAEALGGQLGFAASEIEQFAKVATGLDVATNMSWNDAANNMARFFNIMGTEHDQVENYGSAIVELGNNFATTESEISDMAMRIAGAGASMGLSEADVLGLATALTSVGLSAEAGGSSISQIMVKIDKAVANATDGIEEYASKAGMAVDEYIGFLRSMNDDQFSDYAKSMGMTAKQLKGDTLDSVDSLETWASAAGMSADKFAEAWRNKPIEALTNLFSHMDQAADEGSNLSIMLQELGITTIRQSDVARRVANSSNILVDAVNAANTAYEENTALSREVGRRNESLSAQLDILANCFDSIKTEMGEGLLPIIELGVDVIKPLSGAFELLPTPVKTAGIAILGTLGGFASFWAVIRGITPEVEAFMKALSTNKAFNWVSSIPAATSNIKSLEGATVLANNAFSELAAISTKAAFFGVGALAAGIALYSAKRLYEAKKTQDDFNKALASMGSYSKTATGNLNTYTKYVGMTSTQAKEAAVSTKELTEAINSHNDEMGRIEGEAQTSIAQLQRYKDVIDELGGKSALTSEEHTRLRWALDGINAALGTSITEEEFLSGVYEDEDGNVQDLVAHLDELIAKRQEAARASADEQMYEEALRHETEMQRAYGDTKRALEDRILFYRNLDMPEIGQSREDILDWMSRHGNEDDKELIRDYENVARAADEASQETQAAWQRLANDDSLARAGLQSQELESALRELGGSGDEAAQITSDAFSVMLNSCGGDIDALAKMIMSTVYPTLEIDADTSSIDQAMEDIDKIRGVIDGAMAGTDLSWRNAIGSLGMTVDDFSTKLYNAGITAEDMKNVLDDPNVALAWWIEESGGDLDWLIAKINEYNGKDVEEKEVELDTEKAKEDFANLLGNHEWEDREVTFEIDGDADPLMTVLDNVSNLGMASAPIMLPIIGDSSGAMEALGEVADYSIPDIMVEADAAVDSAVTKLESVTTTADGIPKSKTTTAYANVGSALTNLWSVVSAANSIPSYKSLTVSFQTSGYETAMAKIRNFMSEGSSIIASKNFNAAGGIRYHADGMIVNRPTWLGTRDIVGEAGAEAIIPLTNRKYVQPFADAVAEGMGKQMQPSQTVYNYSINGLTVAPDSALARAMDATFDEAKRYSRMGRR